MLSDSEHEVWLEIRRQTLVDIFSTVCAQLASEKITELSREKSHAHLHLTATSPEVRSECRRRLESAQSTYKKAHGFFSVFDEAYSQLDALIEKDAPTIAAEFSEKNRQRFSKYVRAHYSSLLAFSRWSTSQQTDCIEAYLAGNANPLAFLLTFLDQNSSEQWSAFKKELGVFITHEAFLVSLLGDQQTADTLVKQLRRESTALFSKLWGKEEEELKVELHRQLKKLKHLNQSLAQLGLGPTNQATDLTDVCTWVPAASHSVRVRVVLPRHPIKKADSH